MWGPIVCGPGPFIHWGLKARVEKGYSPGSVIPVQNSLGTRPRTIQSLACSRSHRKEGQKRHRNNLGKKSKISASIEKGTLGSINDQGKLPLLPFNTLHLIESYSPAFTTTPNHSRYGLMGQVSVLECRSYTWTKDKKTQASIKGKGEQSGQEARKLAKNQSLPARLQKKDS